MLQLHKQSIYLSEKRYRQMIDGKGRDPGQHQHVEKLHGGPLPAIGFAADNGHRRSALHGEGKEDHQRQRAAQSHVVVQCGLQAEGVRVCLSAIQSSHSADHDLAGQHAR